MFGILTRYYRNHAGITRDGCPSKKAAMFSTVCSQNA